MMFRLASRLCFMTGFDSSPPSRIVFSIVLVTVQMASIRVRAHGDHISIMRPDLWSCAAAPSVSRILPDDIVSDSGLGRWCCGSRSSRHCFPRNGVAGGGTTRFSSSAPNCGDWDCVRGIWSRASVMIVRFPAGGDRPSYFGGLAPADGRQRRDSDHRSMTA